MEALLILAVGFAIIFFGAELFTNGIEWVGRKLSLAEGAVGSVLWVRQGKDTLAMGNITGAMVFQACLPTVVALLFAPEQWLVGEGSYLVFLSAGMAFAATAAVFLPMARRARLTGRGLLVGGLFYVVYLVVVVFAVSGPA